MCRCRCRCRFFTQLLACAKVCPSHWIFRVAWHFAHVALSPVGVGVLVRACPARLCARDWVGSSLGNCWREEGWNVCGGGGGPFAACGRCVSTCHLVHQHCCCCLSTLTSALRKVHLSIQVVHRTHLAEREIVAPVDTSWWLPKVYFPMGELVAAEKA